MLNKRVIKYIACIVIVSYISVLSAECVLAGQTQLNLKPQLFAQTSPLSPGTAKTAEEERALREIYLDKIRRIEAEMNDARGARSTMVTTGVASLLIGAGVIAGSRTVRDAVEEIPVDPEEKDELNPTLDALDATGGIGTGIAAVSAVSVVGYLIYTGVISSKQKKIDTLRAEMDTKFETRGLTPEYLRRNESVAAVLDEIADTKKSAGTSRTLQALFSRLGMGTLLAGGFLVGLSILADEIVDEIEVDETDPAEVAGKEDALDEAENLQTTGVILLGIGAASEALSFFFRLRARGKARQVEDLEDSLLRVAERIRIQPKIDGVAILYSHEF